MKFPFKKSNAGFSLLEVLFTITIASIVLLAFLSLDAENMKMGRQNIEKLQASLYLRGMIEATKDLEQSNWTEITNATCSTACHPMLSVNTWYLPNGKETIINGTYEAWITIEDVCRDSLTNEIVSCGSNVDSNTKKIIAHTQKIDGTSPLFLESYVYKF